MTQTDCQSFFAIGKIKFFSTLISIILLKDKCLGNCVFKDQGIRYIYYFGFETFEDYVADCIETNMRMFIEG
jgi:hypothetical protein